MIGTKDDLTRKALAKYAGVVKATFVTTATAAIIRELTWTGTNKKNWKRE